MKIKRIWLIVMLFIAIAPALKAQSFNKLWKQVEQAEQKSLPTTVINLTSEIYRKAEAEKNSPQMLKAYTWRMKYKEMLAPDSFYVSLNGLEQWAETTKQPVERAVLHSLIAGAYAEYASQNHWKLHQRGNVASEDWSADIRTWSWKQFVEQVMQHTAYALQPVELLQQTSSEEYVPFVELGKASGEYYHHTMYQLLGTRGIETLRSICFDSFSDSIVTTRIDSLYQSLMEADKATHLLDGYILTMLDYLKWHRDSDPNFRPYRAPQGRIGLTQNPYLAGLDKLRAEYKANDLCAEVYLAKARFAIQTNQQKIALQLCDEAIRLYPNYMRINSLRNLKQEILQPTLGVDIKKEVYPGDSLKLRVSHKNLDGFTVRFYRVHLPEMPKLTKGIDAAFYRKYCSQQSEKHFALLRPSNYQEKKDTLAVTAPSAEGIYLLQMIPDAKVNKLLEHPFYVTRFQVLTRGLPDDRCQVVALDKMTGQPFPDATITIYAKDGKQAKELTTDGAGKVVFPWNNEYRQVKASKGLDRAMPLQYFNGNYYYHAADKSVNVVKLLTDRSVYRPGQTVYVKGIAYEQQSDTARVIADANYTLTLLDVNNQEVAKQEDLRTNDFGSFTTSFTLPSVCLNGWFTLRTQKGSLGFQVEDYKRPTFDITFDQSTTSYRLGDKIEVKGTVQNFSGSPLQDLSVHYTVVRTLFQGWRMLQQEDAPFASGTATLDADGQFTIPVQLLEKENREEGYYRFAVTATVTNVSGETQTSSYNIAAGNRSLLLNAALPERICKEDSIRATFTATNLNGQPVSVEGTARLYPFLNGSKEKVSEQTVYTGLFTSNKELLLDVWKSLPSGAYQLVLSAKDDQGREVIAKSQLVLFSASDTRPVTDSPVWCYASNTSFDAAHPALFYFGTSLKDAYVMVDVLCGSKQLKSEVLHLSDTIVRFDYPYKEEYGNGLTVNFCFVKDGNVYSHNVELQRRLADKKLTMKWDVFRDKLRPGQQEEWKLTIRTPQALPAAAEMLATMYDASLDKIKRSLKWFAPSYQLSLPFISWESGYNSSDFYYYTFREKEWKVPGLTYDRFCMTPSNILQDAVLVGSASMALHETTVRSNNLFGMEKKYQPVMTFDDTMIENSPEALAGIRTNLSETAFFYPQLRTNEQGEVSFSFIMPQSLTRWNFRGYAHTKGMLTGIIDAEATTSKEFMLMPNLPRFVRMGDKASVAASLVNLTGKNLAGTAKFILFDPLTDKIVGAQQQKFAVEAGKTVAVSFFFTVGNKQELLGCRMIADAGTFSDGEQQLIPVLSNKVNLTEAVALPIRGKETRTFTLDSLFNRHSPSATQRRLTVEFTGNPAWYAVQALPALGQPENDNAISWTAMYYANTLASFIMNSQPKVKAVFDSWRQQGGTKESFLSNLQKNQEVKNILLAESPWVLEARTEQQQQQRIGTLFDLNNLRNNNLAALTKLKELQLPDGSWPWYKGMNGSLNITEFIVETNARLVMLTGQPLAVQAQTLQQQAFGYLHQRALEEYDALRKAEKEGRQITRISDATLKYLYLLAISGEEVPAANINACRTFREKLVTMLPSLPMGDKAMAAIVLQQAGLLKQAQEFMRSLKEHLVQTPGQGMSFAFYESPANWNGWQIPAHVMVMEAFEQAGAEPIVVEEMKTWLLGQKQTQQWNSPVATVNAVYALLSRGVSLLERQGDVRISFGGQVLETQALGQESIPGLGYIQKTFTDKKVVDASRITVEKRDEGMAWGAVYGQYLEELSQVKQQGGELAVEKKLYVERLVNNASQLQPLTEQTVLQIGDKVVSRLILRLNRAMQFVQLTDQRAACFEPLVALSGYRWNNGSGYYTDIKDASTRFFFDGLGKGVFVVEENYRVSRAGTYTAGLAILQSAYAPEFVSHSASQIVRVKP